MYSGRTGNRRKIVLYIGIFLVLIIYVLVRLVYIMIFCSEKYQTDALELHEREREIKAPRGEILDRNGVVIATNKTVCTVSVIYSQVTDKEKVIQVLSEELGMDKDKIRKSVEKISVREKIKSNVEKEVGDKIRNYNLDGVKVDEDFSSIIDSIKCSNQWRKSCHTTFWCVCHRFG